MREGSSADVREDGQKMATLTRQIKETRSRVRMAVRGETIYLSRGSIPGGRGGPKPRG
jgi:hypothetical protein